MKSWRSAGPFTRNSPIDTYLKNRGIDLTDDEALSLRITPAQWHWPSQSRWPAMLAKVTLADGTDLTTHQTFVQHDGSGKAPVEKPRLFAAGGRTAGGGVWFGKPDPEREFAVAEGIESALSTMRLYGLTAGCAALSKDGMPRLILPPEARRVLMFADHDGAGQGLAEAHKAQRQWRAEGRTVAVKMVAEGWPRRE